MGMSRGKKRKEKGMSYRGNNNRSEIEQEKGEEEGCMEIKVYISNKWWKIMKICCKEMKTTRRRVEDALKENREECLFTRGDFSGRIEERGTRNWEEERGMGKENPKTRWKMQRGRD
jgi:hypothetical protein